MDRKKDITITGNGNVYSIEVENIHYSHRAILKAAVIGLPVPQWGEAVKAIVVLGQEASVMEEEIIQHRKKILPGIRRRNWTIFTRTAITSFGKILKKGL